MNLNEILEFSHKYFEQGIISFIITSLIILLVSIIANKFIKKFSDRIISKKKIDVTAGKFITKIINGVIYVLCFFGITLQIIPFQKFALSLLASSSIAIVVLGFATQEAFSNIVAGMFISIFKPFSVGDIVTIKDKNITGKIIDINLRHTVILTFENNSVIIANSIMNQSIIENRDFYDSIVNNFLFIGISYDADIELAKEIIMKEIKKHKLALIDDDHPTNILCTNLSDFTVELRANIYSNNTGEGAILLSDLRQSIKKEFDKNQIEIPYPYQNVIIKKS